MSMTLKGRTTLKLDKNRGQV